MTGSRRPLIIVGGQAYGGDEDVAIGLGAEAFGADAGRISRLLRERYTPIAA